MKIPSLAVLIAVLCVIPLLATAPRLAASDPTDRGSTAWALPLPGVPAGAIISEFTPPTSPFGSGHRGVDFPAVQGQRVVAVGSGIVSFAGSIAGKPVISIELSHVFGAAGTRVRSTYEPVASLVSTGDFVTKGRVIGYIDFAGGNGGHCLGICLHFGLKVVNEPAVRYLNPRTLWRSVASLHPTSVGYPNLSAGGHAQKSFAVFQR